MQIAAFGMVRVYFTVHYFHPLFNNCTSWTHESRLQNKKLLEEVSALTVFRCGYSTGEYQGTTNKTQEHRDFNFLSFEGKVQGWSEKSSRAASL